MYRIILMGSVAALGLVGCKTPCEAAVTLNEDAAHSAQLVWSGPDGAATVAYSGATDPDDRAGVVASDGGEHTATLWGLASLAEITYSFTVDGETCTDTFTAAGVPSGLPTFTVTSYDEDAADGWRYLAGVAMGDTGTLLIVDRDGRWRWHEVHDEAINVSAVALAGDTLLYNSFDQDRTNDIGQVHARPLLGEGTVDTRTEGGHHTFAYLPDGTIAFPSIDVRTWLDPDDNEEVSVVGDRILEVAPDGTVTELWSIWDHEEPVKHGEWDSGFYGSVGKDWTHANALNYNAERDTYLLSLGHLDTIYEIDRSTGEVLLRLTPDSVADGSTVYNFQHDPNWSDDGTLMLLSYPEGQPATAIEYSVSSDGTMEEVWSYQRDKSGTTLLGQARRLPNGNTFINFGGIGEIREVTPAGEVVWQMNASLGSWFGNSVLLDTLPVLP